ncbi:MAG: CoA transferase [Candidatus Rokubacteria bacterium]|nr:CoA transferase [Candidatus Rokubacteria bacterium]
MSASAGVRIRVLDLAEASGVFCTRLLVGLGAEVIRLEPPGGDPLRAAPPLGLPFRHWNAGKRSLSLDLEKPEGCELFLRLVETADVLVETFPPGRLAALGLGYEDLNRVRPELILVSITPFGQTGPRAGWCGTDLTAAALGGMMALCGEPDGPPLRPPCEQAFHLAGVNGAIGALLALRARRLTGRGQHVDVSVQEAVAAALEYGAVSYIHQGVIHRRRGSRYPHVLHGLFRARDGFVAGGVSGSPRMWQDLLAWMAETGQTGDLLDPEWAEETVRLRERDHLFDVIEAFTRRFSKAAFHREAQRRRLPWAPVDRPEEVAANPQLTARGFFVEVDVRGRTARDVGFAFGFPEGQRPTRLRVPPCGEANTEVLAELDALPRRAPPRARRATGTPAPARGALGGTRVLDLTWVLAGPYATRILADHGADVVKVESRHRPDASRFAAALHLSRDPHRHPDTSGYFNNYNRNKRSITLNLEGPEGLALLRRLAAMSDVVIENFSARVMARWGLDFAGLSAIRPDIILVSMAGMGHTGPWRDHVTYADALAALAGLTAQMGYPDRDPVGLTFGLGDMLAGAHAALATLAALEYRDATGRGQHVDLSQVEAVAAHLGTSVLEVTAAGLRSRCPGNRHPGMAPHGAFPCRGADRWCAIAVETEGQWRALCAAMGRPELADDPRFATLEARKAHEEALESLIGEWTRGRDAETVMTRLQAAGVPAGVVQDARDLVEHDPHLRVRGFYEPAEHPVVGVFPHEGVVARLGETPGRVWHAAPRLGEHTREILGELLGVSDADIVRYEAAGVLG